MFVRFGRCFKDAILPRSRCTEGTDRKAEEVVGRWAFERCGWEYSTRDHTTMVALPTRARTRLPDCLERARAAWWFRSMGNYQREARE